MIAGIRLALYFSLFQNLSQHTMDDEGGVRGGQDACELDGGTEDDNELLVVNGKLGCIGWEFLTVMWQFRAAPVWVILT